MRKNRKKHSKLWGLGLVVLSLGTGLQAATQIKAHELAYQAALGAHVFHLYPPWSILTWAGRSAPEGVIPAAFGGLLVTVIGVLFGIAVSQGLSNRPRANETLHGSARWADKKDIENAGLLPRLPEATGVYVGGWQDPRGTFHYLRHGGPEHILTYAPTRSGKGVGLVIPTLLSWPMSCVVTDLKGELWALTASWRRQHARNVVLRFEPAALEGGVCWNPLDEIRLGTDHEVGDVQNLATLIVDPDGRELETHWQKTSFALLVGVITHALYKAQNEATAATLAGIDALFADPESLFKEMVSYPHWEGLNHVVANAGAHDMMSRPPEEAGSVLSTAKSYLALYRDPVVAENTGRSDFSLKDLMHHENLVSLYIVTQPTDKARLRSLVRLMLSMIIRALADRMTFENGRPKAHYKHRLLMMLDEFPSLGRLEILQEALAFLAGCGIKCYLVCQDITQLKSRETGYGPDETITSNCHVQNAYPPNRLETAEHLSRLVGQATIVKEQITVDGRRLAAFQNHVSRTYQEVQRPLLTPGECLRIPGPVKDVHGSIEQPGDMLIQVAGFPPIYGKQPLYFKDPVFLARASLPPPATSDRCR